MENRNCPNCGAALEADKSKCPYCGTSYFDLCSINIDNGEPFWLKFRTNYGGKLMICTMLVRAEPNLMMTMRQEPVAAVCGNYYQTLRTHPELELEMTFRSVQRNCINEHLARFELEAE